MGKPVPPVRIIIILPISTKAVGGMETPIKAKKRRKNVTFAFHFCFSFRAVAALSSISLAVSEGGGGGYSYPSLFHSFLALWKRMRYITRDTTPQAL